MTTTVKRAKIRTSSLNAVSNNHEKNSLTSNFIKRELILEGLCCANCAAKIERQVGELYGVGSSTVNFVTKTLILEIEEISKASELIAAAKQIVNKIEPDVVVKEKEETKSIRKVLLLEGLG